MFAVRWVAVFLAVLWPVSAVAGVTLIDDFEDVSDWSRLTLETTLVQQGSGAGRWADTVTNTTVRKTFAAPLDLSARTHLGFWMHSAVANGAQLQLVLDSDNSATSGSDYYSRELTLDWTGWRWIWLSKAELAASRTPLGWNHITGISLNASGWSHEPLPDTALVLDQMVMASAVLTDVRQTQGWRGADFVYTFDLTLREPDGAALGVDLSAEAAGLGLNVSPQHVDLAANGTATAQVEVTITPAVASAGAYLPHDLAIVAVSGGAAREEWRTRVANPGPRQAAPRGLLDAQDFTRIQDWASRHSWAQDRVDGLVARATSWQSDYLGKYGLSSFDLPPEGGQWGMHYVCPTHGANLQYSPPMTHRCPIDGATFSGWPYDQVIYGRQHGDLAVHARTNGLAYQLTGNAAFADAAADLLLRYAQRYGAYPLHDINGGAGGSGARVLAQTLDESGWLVDVAWAYDLVAESGALDAAERAQVEQGLLRASATTIQRHDAGLSNWQAWHNAAIATAGRAIDDPALVSFAVHGQSGFHRHMAESVLADGFWYEGSWGYHFFTVTPMTYLAELGERGGFPLWDDPALRAMFTAPILFAPPDLVLPSFNDSGTVDLRGSAQWRMEAAYEAFGDPVLLVPIVHEPRRDESLFWGPEVVPDTAPVVDRSLLFEASGFAVMRGGTSADPWYLALDYGPHGGWHGHFDKLGFVFYARGKTLGLDPGSHSYALPLHDSWDRATLAHNTVVIDETSQVEATGNLQRFVAMPGLVWTRADAGDAYASADLTRDLVMLDGYVLDRFEIRSRDGQPHDADWLYHNPGEPGTGLTLSAYGGFPNSGGYQHLTNNRSATTDGDASFDFGFAGGGTYPGGFWASDPGIVASSLYSDADAHGGDWAGELRYDFSAAPGTYITFRTRSLAEVATTAPSHVAVWVRGDGSGNELRIRVVDSTGESFVSPGTTVDFTGWQRVEFDVTATWSHWSGNDDGVIDTPLSNLVLEVRHASGGTTTGALLVDDWTLTLGGAPVLVEDYELLVASERVTFEGRSGTVFVTGNGIGPNLTEPVPYVMSRRRGQALDFDALHEPFGGAGPQVQTFATLVAEGQDHQGYVIAAPADGGFDDLLLLGGGGTGMRAYGDASSDAALVWLREGFGALQRLALVDGSVFSRGGVVIFEAPAPLDQVAFVVQNGEVEIVALSGELEGARLLAPGTTSVTLANQPVDFSMDGDVVVFGAPPAWPEADEQDTTGSDTAPSDTTGGADVSELGDATDLGVDGAGADVVAEAPDGRTGDDGCGCGVRRQRPIAAIWLCGLGALLVWRRRRSLR